MAQKTVLVTGASGFLGREVVKAFDLAGWKVVGTGLTRANPPAILKVDLTSEKEIEKVLDDVKPDIVVHCAAERFPDKCASDPEGTKALNVSATQALASRTTLHGILLIYISTDYVFSGLPGQAPYGVEAEPGPTNFYGETKLAGEKAVLEIVDKKDVKGSVVVLRVPVLYGHVESSKGNRESAINVLLDEVKKAQGGVAVKMDHWSKRFPTNTEDVARVCKDIATLYISPKAPHPLPKILHFSSRTAYTKYEICQLLAEILHIRVDTLEPNPEGNDPNAKIQRPYDCQLSNDALEKLGINASSMDFTGWWRLELRARRG